MARRVAFLAALALLVAGSSSTSWAGGGDRARKERIDERIARLRAEIAAANRREGVLTSQISEVTSRIHALQDDVAQASSRLAALESELAVYERRLERLTELLELQTRRVRLLTTQERIAEERLYQRLVAIYEADDPSALEVVFSASSFTELLDGLDYVNQIGRQDRRLARDVAAARRQAHTARVRTARTRRGVQHASEAIRSRVNEQRAERDRLVSSREALAVARAVKSETLGAVRAREDEAVDAVDDLTAESSALGARIRAAQAPSPSSGRSAPSSASSSSTGGVSSAGFIWPVSGPVTSGFGWRWGRMHEGIDISASTGTPIRAAAAGSVIVAGWSGGYGNLVVIDHGGGVSTAYGHQSAIGSGVGQTVAQGQVIGYVGSTGNSTGPHLHFEVRINGSPVDPMGYL
jgi:murein DD-endopeptidase MepM/ murein hydrolase activator NlpD